MATTAYGVNHPLAVKQWARRLFREALKETYISRFIGSGTNSLIYRRDELSRGPGDRITYGLRMQLSGDGVTGDATLEGNEEALVTYSDNILIDQKRHAVRSAGKMSEQRVPFSVREEARSGLTDWWSDRWDTEFFNHICGNTVANTQVPANPSAYNGHNTVVAPSATRIIRPPVTGTKATADESLSNTTVHTFDLQLIDQAVEAAKVASPLIRPIRYQGGEHYVMFLHPFQVTDLRTKTSTGQWQDITKAQLGGNGSSDNPIFTGALGMYNNVILHEAVRVTQGVSAAGAAISTVRRAVLCGAQSATIAFGGGSEAGSMNWVEDMFDYDNQLGVSAGAIYGLKKTVFNSVDFGTIVVPTYAAAKS
jgi:N4-gp56 family major capsid protein